MREWHPRSEKMKDVWRPFFPVWIVSVISGSRHQIGLLPCYNVGVIKRKILYSPHEFCELVFYCSVSFYLSKASEMTNRRLIATKRFMDKSDIHKMHFWVVK